MVSGRVNTKPLNHIRRTESTEVQKKYYFGPQDRETQPKEKIAPGVKFTHAYKTISRLQQNAKKNLSDSLLYSNSKKKEQFSFKEMRGLVGTIYQYDASKKLSLPCPSMKYVTSSSGRPRISAVTRSPQVKPVSSLFSTCISTLLDKVRKRPDSSKKCTRTTDESDLEPEDRIINDLERKMKTERNWLREKALPMYMNYKVSLRKESEGNKRNSTLRKDGEKTIFERRSAYCNKQERIRSRESTSQAKGTECKALGVAARRRVVFPGPPSPVRIRSDSSPSTCDASCGSSLKTRENDLDWDKDPQILRGKFPKTISTALVHRWIKRTAADVRPKNENQSLSSKIPICKANRAGKRTYETTNHLKKLTEMRINIEGRNTICLNALEV